MLKAVWCKESWLIAEPTSGDLDCSSQGRAIDML